MISVTFGFHWVMVQVLSKTIAFILQAVSNGSHHLIRIQFLAHIQVHTIIAVGVASHKAQGQAITITAAKYNNDCSNVQPIKKYQTRNVKIAIIITNGTNTADILSATDCISAFDHCASSIKRTI